MARPATVLVLQVADARTGCLSNPDLVLAPRERLWSQLALRKQASEIAGVVVDTVRPRRELVLENAVLCHQANVLRRGSERPKLQIVDRLKRLLGARWLPSWRRAIVLVQPETVPRWHRAGLRPLLAAPFPAAKDVVAAARDHPPDPRHGGAGTAVGRRELLDHVLLIHDQHLTDLLRQYQRHFDESRSHQGIEQRVPAGSLTITGSSTPVAVTSVLGGLHVDYRRAA